MITRGAPESASAPASPSSRAPAVPSDSEAPAATAVVVDVTGGEEPWTATSARRTSDPPLLRSSKRSSARSAPDTATAEARKGKKAAAKRLTAGTATSAAKPPTRDTAGEEGCASPGKEDEEDSCAKRPAGHRSDQGFDLTTFMASFQPGRGGATDDPSQAERGAPTARPVMWPRSCRHSETRWRAYAGSSEPTAHLLETVHALVPRRIPTPEASCHRRSYVS
ncbi:hypothetical protein PHYSODRAFT_305754 [Phytophthora sojae]|uniref:Uncharacterized protein n=1 Tax=Phytophthora sojae (strain P6497) TaxID=1094619 RepID=G5A6F7_PHYSP|nr:hypothetical protein PHYSODRAFT_305754 [Phytophthora sojae]EGZ08912.1 hypothetical protein PHYSODRAFT_305754 [Phytophthora sojae]|eukprot:XP_009535545.1 hypothetical protein PHYSODRAFT_305754 [Phytophthora sojae]